jgi:hypothetical protein
MIAGLAALLGALPALIQALPYLLELLLLLMKSSISLVAWAKENNVKGWIQELESSVDGLLKSKTPQEKWDSAKRFADLIGNLPK